MGQYNNQQQPNQYTVISLLGKLNELYKQEELIEQQMKILMRDYEQLRDDIEMLEMMIMHTSNKEARS